METIEAKLAYAAATTGWRLQQHEFDPSVYIAAMQQRDAAEEQKPILYTYIDDACASDVIAFLHKADKRAGYKSAHPFETQHVSGATLIVGPNIFLLTQGSYVSKHFLVSVFEPETRAKEPCFSCGAPGRYIDDANTSQCMECPARICRACVRDGVDVLVSRFARLRDTELTNTIADFLFCPRCPNCKAKRFCDRTQLVAKCHSVLTAQSVQQQKRTHVCK